MAGSAPTSAKLDVLLRTRGRSIANAVGEVVRETPVRLAAAIVLIAVIWSGLYLLFTAVFQQLERTPLEATVAIPMVFNFFFIAMLVLLAFSNAILSYGALFGQRESSYLLTLPVKPRDVVTFKYLEGLVFSSWSVVLLGLPLMLAMADFADEPASRLLFLAFFLAFIPIPGAIGLLLSWIIARWLPRNATKAILFVAAILVVTAFVTGVQSIRAAAGASEFWLRSFLARMSFIESAFLPNNWVASGIDHALQGQFSESSLYLGVTLANAFFLSWLAVTVVSARLDVAYDRASAGHSAGRRAASTALGGVAGNLFFYLPRTLRLMAAKDFRTFFRDPAQWSQLSILFGLLLLYLTNMPTLRLQLTGRGLYLMIPFFNLCAVCLILATFTCRFVFPLMSLEGSRFWLSGVAPIRKGKMLIAKLAFAITVTLVVALGAMGFAAVALRLEPAWTLIHLFVTIAICFGLCALSVGIGARMPMFAQSDPARIANGLGGTVNLLASLAMVAVSLTGVGIATYRSGLAPGGTMPDLKSLLCCASSAVIPILCGLVALWMGARHFERIEI